MSFAANTDYLKASTKNGEISFVIIKEPQSKSNQRRSPFLWGYRRVRAYLKRKYGIMVSYSRVYRIMKKNDLLVDQKSYKAKRTPQKDKPKQVKSNQWWGIDMTKFYINSLGWVYLVIVLDWYTKKVVSYKLNLRSKAEDWIEALNIAVENNCPLGSREYDLHLMSDNGTHPTSEKFENAATLIGNKYITTS